MTFPFFNEKPLLWMMPGYISGVTPFKIKLTESVVFISEI